MTSRLMVRVPVAIIVVLTMIIAVIAVPGSTYAGAPDIIVFGTNHTAGETSDVGQADYVPQKVDVTDEYALDKIEETFGPEVSASLQYRATETATADSTDGPIRLSTMSSSNWCGMQVQDYRANSIRATMRVSTTSGDKACNAAWVGLGDSDWPTENLIQVGYCMRAYGGAQFRAFYELLPADPVWITNFTIARNHMLGATVQRDWNYGSNYYFVCIFNQTTGYYFAQTFYYQVQRSCAEWIVETPDVCRIGTMNPTYQRFNDAYWWDAGNPYTTYSYSSAINWWNITMHTNHGEHMRCSTAGAYTFLMCKTSQ